MIKNLGLQLYTIRDYMRDEAMLDFAFGRMHDFGYTEAQTAGWSVPVETFAALAEKHGIKIVGTHYSWEKMIEDTDGAMEEHKLLGTTNMGIGGMPGYARNNSSELYKFCEEANKLAEKISKYGFKFTYHNHSFEFCKLDNGKTMMQILVEELDPKNTSFVLDTYWVQHGGGDIRAWMEKLAGRIDILHLKDMKMDFDQQRFASIGDGNIDFKAIVELADKIGVKHYVVEQDSYWVNDNAMKAIENSAEYIKANLM